MCGICGILNKNKDDHVEKPVIWSMCDIMKHRGPDEDGFYFNRNVALGMRRLKVIDLDTGSQPMFSDDNNIVIVFNGEIYNFLELKQHLKKKGMKFFTKSDTEVILKLYEAYGENFLRYLEGMFAIAIWDDRSKQLLLARDRLGEKPLHYSITKRGIIFSSEIKSILCDPQVDREIDLTSIYFYFLKLCVPAPRTIYKHISKLLPGHYLTYRAGKTKIHQYWDVVYAPDYHKSEAYFCEQIKNLITESVRKRMISDVPLGAFLSGGIDSSIIVGLMSRLSIAPIKTFSIGFKERRFNELAYARIVSNRFKTEHHEFIVDPEVISLAEKIASFFDEPFGGPSAIPTFIISQLARQHVTVALTGDGGDEIFAGYESYLTQLRRRKLRFIPERLRKFVANKIANPLPDRTYGKRFLQSLTFDELSYFSGALQETWKRNIFSQDFIKKIGNVSVLDVHNLYHNKPIVEYLSQFQYLDTKHYLPDNVLVKVDRMSMANSLETRTAFLNHELVELAARIPANLKITNKITKYILKKSMVDLLPEEIMRRNKWGFALPIGIWFKHELRDLIAGMVNNQPDDIFNYRYLRKILNEHLVGRREHGHFLWSYFIFKLWQKK